MSASRGKKAYNKGLQLEKDFAIWMRKKLGYTRVMPRQFVYGKIAARPYEVDIFGIKELLIMFKKSESRIINFTKFCLALESITAAPEHIYAPPLSPPIAILYFKFKLIFFIYFI